MKILSLYPEYSTEQVIEKLKQEDEFKFLQTEIVDNEEVAVKATFQGDESNK